MVSAPPSLCGGCSDTSGAALFSFCASWFCFCSHQELPCLSDPAGDLQLTQTLGALISPKEERSWIAGTEGWAGQLIQKFFSSVLV